LLFAFYIGNVDPSAAAADWRSNLDDSATAHTFPGSGGAAPRSVRS
jgi:hypothetical protein